LAVGWRQEAFGEVDAQNLLIAFPLTLIAIGLGVRVIAGEIDRRTLEIAYTVPGGAPRVWLFKLLACAALLLATAALLALVTYLFFTAFPLGALYGAMQAALVYLLLAMGLSTLFRSEATGALVAAVVLVLNGLFTGFGQAQIRFSPFFNPVALPRASAEDLLAWTVQNRIGMVLLAAAIVALAFARAERRETMLAG
jgi:ABC-type transport system involved in multi-copper enzyme maturation permease subunit